MINGGILVARRSGIPTLVLLNLSHVYLDIRYYGRLRPNNKMKC